MGFQVTRAQLHRWQQGGLLPKPEQRGLGRGRGTEVLYPAGSTRQLRALCELLRQKRSLDRACWALWWEGYPVSRDRIWRLFEKRVARAIALRDAWIKTWKEYPAEGEPNLEGVIDKWARGRLSDPVLEEMRQRIGRTRFPTVINRALDAVLGISGEFLEDDAEIVAKAIGFSEDAEEAPARLTEAAKVLDPRRLQEALENASIEDLEVARDEIKRMLLWADALIALLEAVLGRSLDQLLRDAFRPTFELGPHYVLIWLSVMRGPQVRQLYEGLLLTARAIADGSLSAEDAARMSG